MRQRDEGRAIAAVEPLPPRALSLRHLGVRSFRKRTSTSDRGRLHDALNWLPCLANRSRSAHTNRTNRVTKQDEDQYARGLGSVPSISEVMMKAASNPANGPTNPQRARARNWTQSGHHGRRLNAISSAIPVIHRWLLLLGRKPVATPPRGGQLAAAITSTWSRA